MSALGERTLVLLLTDTESLETMVRHGVNPVILPTIGLRDVLVWAMTHYQSTSKAPTADVLRERFTPDFFTDKQIDLDEDVEETIEWAIDDLEGTYVQQEVGKFIRQLAIDTANTPPEHRVEMLGAQASALSAMVLSLQPRTTHIDIRESGPDLLAEYELAANSDGVRGMRFGIPEMDAHYGGIWPGELFVVGGPAGCLSGDSLIQVCRGGNSGKRTIKSLVEAFNGKHKTKRWDPNIETYVQRAEGDHVRLALLGGAWESGVKETFTITTESGRSLRGTAEHPFQVPGGEFVPLGELRPGSLVRVNAGKSNRGRGEKPDYKRRATKYHPNQVYRGAKSGYAVAEHRLVVEAGLNGLSLDELIRILRTAPEVAVGLTYLPVDLAVHHIDHNHRNNHPDNLEVLSHAEHHRRHAAEGKSENVWDQIGVERVASIKRYGMEETYDLTVEDDPHNYVANGFVVHNTGKSFWANLVAYNEWARGVNTTIFSLENSILMNQMRIACCALHIPIDALQTGSLEPEQYEELRTWCNDVLANSETPLNIITPEMVNRSPQALIQQARAYDTESLIVDQLTHIQPVDPTAQDSRNQEVAKIVRTLSDLINTGRTKIPCLLMHQIHREGIKRASTTGRLVMTDFAESAEIERSATVAASLWQSDEMKALGRMQFQSLKQRRVTARHWDLSWQPWMGLVHTIGQVDFSDVL